MNNLNAVKSLCNAIVSSFHPDSNAIGLVLMNGGIDPEAEAVPKDPEVFRAALALVMGYVESSRSESGLSVSVMGEDAIKSSLAYWCNLYGLDAAEELAGYVRTIEDGSNLW